MASRRTRVLAVAAVLLVTLTLTVVGCGGSSNKAVSNTPVVVHVRIRWFDGDRDNKPVYLTKSFTLTCDPTGGTLPFAAQVCDAIAAHRRAMLDLPRSRSFCSGAFGGPNLAIVATTGTRTVRFGGQPFCDWPGGTALGIYWAASQHDLRTLVKVEPRLRCDTDPRLLAMPTPWASVSACIHGLWTARSEHLIAEATLAAGLPAGARALFPRDRGALPCAIPIGGPIQGKTMPGTCGVSVRDVKSVPTVTFVEDWPRGGKPDHRYSWQITISRRGPRVTQQTGPIPPQAVE